MNYLSPERNNNFFSLSLESDIYSLGLIYWHIFLFAKSPVKNWKLITENTYFSPTETVWDDFFETCLQEQGTQRYKSTHALVKALPRVGNEVNTSEKNQSQTTAPSAIIDKEQQNDHTSQNTFETRQPKQNFLEIEKLKEILKKRKVAIAVVLILVIAGLFKFCSPAGTIIDPPKPEATVNATSNEEVSVNSEEEKTDKLINPEGYTVKPGKEAVLTENGLNKDGAFYRYFNGKWEVKPKTSDATKSNWQPLKDVDKSFIIALFFSINSSEENKKIEEEKKNETKIIDRGSTPRAPQPPVPQPPKPSIDPNDCIVGKAKLNMIENDARHFFHNIPKDKVKQKRDELLIRLKSIDTYDCEDLIIEKEKILKFIHRMEGY